MTDTKKPTAAEVAIAEIREYFEDRQDASMEPGEDRFHGNKEMGLLEEVATVEAALLRLSDSSSATRHKTLLRTALEAVRDEIDGRADIDGEGRANIFMRLDTVIDAALEATK